MNAKLKKESKKYFEKDFLKLINNSFFGKTVKNIRIYRDVKLGTTDKRKKQLVSESNYHPSKYFSEQLTSKEMKKAKVKMNKPLYLEMSILDIRKTLMYQFWYDYIKPKHKDRAKLCYMDADSFVIYNITEDFYKDIAADVERWFDKYKFDENNKRPLLRGIKKIAMSF